MYSNDATDYGFGDLQVREVVIIASDGFVIGLIERRAPPLHWSEGLGSMTHQFNSSQVVRDYDVAAGFYRDVLGWKPVVEVTTPSEGEPSWRPMAGSCCFRCARPMGHPRIL